MIAKFHACSLIWVIKVDIFNLIKSLFKNIIITQEIVNETVEEGLKKGYSDAKIIQKKINDKEITVIQCEKKIFSNLGDGEAEVITKTQKEREKGLDAIFITQDVKAKKIALKNNIPTQGVEVCLLEAALKKKIGREDFLLKLYELGTEFLIPNERLIEIEKFYEMKGG